MSHEHDHDHHNDEQHRFHEPYPCDGVGHQHHHHEDGSCCCEHHAKEFHGIDRPMLIRLIVSAVLYLAGMLLPVEGTVEMLLMLCSALVAGYDIIWSAISNLMKKRVFDEYFLMSFAAVAAFVIGEYEEAAAVFVLYRIGAFCQSYAIRHSRRRIASLTGDEKLLDQEMIIRNRFISRFAKIYTPIIIGLAILISVLLPVIGETTWHDSIYRALTFLVLACPCAIVISVPLAYFAGIGAAMKKNIFFHDSGTIDLIAEKGTQKIELISIANDSGNVYVYEGELKGGEKTSLVLREKESLQDAYRIAKKTRYVTVENVCFTILVKLTVLILSIIGISQLWFAVFADSGVTVIVVLNALRAFYAGKIKLY